ncbi:beta-hydroxyacyl-ACP dehydratase [Gammaproteobacteria bacterium]|nr:beta-hydroxyacyl-ACP dehydratase [Gammaproteobacteria bacterium]
MTKDKGFSLTLDGIHRFQKNREPYLLIDYVEEVVPGATARGHVDLVEDMWFFAVHWPDDPNMPGLLQIESLVQMAALTILTLPGHRGEVVYLTQVSKAKFSRKVIPGDRLQLDTELVSFRRGIGKCIGRGSVLGEKACRAEFSIVVPSVVSEYATARMMRN